MEPILGRQVQAGVAQRRGFIHSFEGRTGPRAAALVFEKCPILAPHEDGGSNQACTKSSGEKVVMRANGMDLLSRGVAPWVGY